LCNLQIPFSWYYLQFTEHTIFSRSIFCLSAECFVFLQDVKCQGCFNMYVILS
jgi:hypothetical protein